MAEINFVMWNCSGILPSSSAEEKFRFLGTATNSKFDVLVLVETHHKSIDDVTCLSTIKNNYHIIHTEAETDDPYGGIIVLASRAFTISRLWNW